MSRNDVISSLIDTHDATIITKLVDCFNNIYDHPSSHVVSSVLKININPYLNPEFERIDYIIQIHFAHGVDQLICPVLQTNVYSSYNILIGSDTYELQYITLIREAGFNFIETKYVEGSKYILQDQDNSYLLTVNAKVDSRKDSEGRDIDFEITTQTLIENFTVYILDVSTTGLHNHSVLHRLEFEKPTIAFDVIKNNFAYTYSLYVKIRHGEYNVESNTIDQGDILILLDEFDVTRGIGSLVYTDTFMLQGHTNSVTVEKYKIKLFKYSSNSCLNGGKVYNLKEVYLYCAGNKIYDHLENEYTYDNPLIIKLGEIDTLLHAPYQWVSVNSINDDDDFQYYFQSIIPALKAIKTKKALLQKSADGTFIGGLRVNNGLWERTVKLSDMYIVKLDYDIRWTFHGKPLIDANIVYNMEKGENWVGFPFTNSYLFDDFINTYFTFSRVTSVNSREYSKIFTEQGYIGDLQRVDPNEGYVMTLTNSLDLNVQFTNINYTDVNYSHEFDITIPSFPITSAQLKILSANTCSIQLLDTIVTCTTQTDFSSLDDDINTFIPSYFEGLCNFTYDDIRFKKIMGVVSFTFEMLNGSYEIKANGIIDAVVQIGQQDPFTEYDPQEYNLSDIEHYFGDTVENRFIFFNIHK
jgi:hypothetical protein